MVKQSIHPNNSGIVLNVSENLVPVALVKWVHKTSDLGVVGYVEHSIFWSCRDELLTCKKKKKKKEYKRKLVKSVLDNVLFYIFINVYARYIKGLLCNELDDHTFCYAVAIDLLVVSVTCALERSFGVGAIMWTRVKLQTFVDLWKKTEKPWFTWEQITSLYISISNQKLCTRSEVMRYKCTSTLQHRTLESRPG